MDDLIARLRALSSSPARDSAGLGDYWNALDEAADALEKARNEALEEAAKWNDNMADSATQRAHKMRDDAARTPWLLEAERFRLNAAAIRAMKK